MSETQGPENTAEAGPGSVAQPAPIATQIIAADEDVSEPESQA